jgi:hypothetical protein
MFTLPSTTSSATASATTASATTANTNTTTTIQTGTLPQTSKYKNGLYPPSTSSSSNEMNYNMIDALLETEKQRNKTEAWNKLDKTQKTLNLHAFAEKYGKEHGLPMKEIKHLKSFFSDCLDKAKLQKTKDVVYDKEKHEIISVPSLFFNTTNRAFTLRSLDTKRVSTLKSLTPKRVGSNVALSTQDEIETGI